MVRKPKSKVKKLGMSRKALKALKGSILKWENIILGKTYDRGVINCPLCKLYNNYKNNYSCEGCPVSKRTGKRGCMGTPYEGWNGSWVKTDSDVLVAYQELQFLRSLLPQRTR